VNSGSGGCSANSGFGFYRIPYLYALLGKGVL